MSLASSRSRARISRLPSFNLAAKLGAALAARRQRIALAKLDNHLLDDIGVTRKDAWSETKRPFWELPERHHW